MRTAARRRHREEEEESVFVSMTDMTVSFLFIVIILLAFFASQLSDEDMVPKSQLDDARGRIVSLESEVAALQSEKTELETELEKRLMEITRRDARVAALEGQLAAADREIADLQRQVLLLTAVIKRLAAEKAASQTRIASQAETINRLVSRIVLLESKPPDPLETYLARVAAERRRILEALQTRIRLDFPDLQVIVSTEMDALRFKGDGLFASASSDLADDKRRIVETIATRLNAILPCYTFGPRSAWREDCNPAGAVIEAVQIEGHTDSSGQGRDNMELSTARANQTFFAMTTREPTLIDSRNSQDQPVLSVAGYGEMRPVAVNTSVEGRATNRRIDLRIIMYTPHSEDEIAAIRERLRRGVAGEAAP